MLARSQADWSNEHSRSAHKNQRIKNPKRFPKIGRYRQHKNQHCIVHIYKNPQNWKYWITSTMAWHCMTNLESISVLLKTTANSSSLPLSWPGDSWASAFRLHGGLFHGSPSVGAPLALSSHVVLFQSIQSNVPDPYLGEGLAKIVDLQLLCFQNHSNFWRQQMCQISGNVMKTSRNSVKISKNTVKDIVN